MTRSRPTMTAASTPIHQDEAATCALAKEQRRQHARRRDGCGDVRRVAARHRARGVLDDRVRHHWPPQVDVLLEQAGHQRGSCNDHHDVRRRPILLPNHQHPATTAVAIALATVPKAYETHTSGRSSHGAAGTPRVGTELQDLVPAVEDLRMSAATAHRARQSAVLADPQNSNRRRVRVVKAALLGDSCRAARSLAPTPIVMTECQPTRSVCQAMPWSGSSQSPRRVPAWRGEELLPEPLRLASGGTADVLTFSDMLPSLRRVRSQLCRGRRAQNGVGMKRGGRAGDL